MTKVTITDCKINRDKAIKENKHKIASDWSKAIQWLKKENITYYYRFDSKKECEQWRCKRKSV